MSSILKSGQPVKITGLKTEKGKKFNQLQGRIKKYNEKRGRYEIEIIGEEGFSLLIKRENLDAIISGKNSPDVWKQLDDAFKQTDRQTGNTPSPTAAGSNTFKPISRTTSSISSSSSGSGTSKEGGKRSRKRKYRRKKKRTRKRKRKYRKKRTRKRV